MNIDRRALIVTSIASAMSFPAQALQATPTAAMLPPEEILRALLASPVSSPLLPGDLGELVAVDWADDNDSDLVDTVGGVLVQAGPEDDAPLVGVYIVHQTPNDAAARLDPNLLVEPPEVFTMPGLAGVVQREEASEFGPASTLIAVSTGPLIVSAIGEGEDPGANDLRALATLAGLLDHLRLVTAPV